MPCEHKFIQDLDLSYVEHLGYKPKTLIIGTFNPAWPEGNNAPWFYGRTHDAHAKPSNRFWHVLPVLYGHAPLMNAGPDEWKDFCKDNGIAITDMIRCIKDAHEHHPEHRRILASCSDKGVELGFHDHDANPLAPLLVRFPTIQHVYITRTTTYAGLWQDLSQELRDACQSPNRTYSDLLTPSPYAIKQIGRWNRVHPHDQANTIEDLLVKRWKQVWHF